MKKADLLESDHIIVVISDHTSLHYSSRIIERSVVKKNTLPST